MPISSATARVDYNGNGSTTSFAVNFKFLANSHVVATHKDAAGTETTWTENTQYTLTGAGVDTGGTLTVSTSPTDYTPATGETLIIRRVVPLTQETDYPEGGAFPSSAHETALDKLTMLVQQLQEQYDRALRLPVSDDGADELPTAENRASKYLTFGADGSITVTANALGDTVITDFAETLLDDASAAAMRATLGLSTTVIDTYVADSGAVGDGATDDTAAFATAIAATPTGGILRLTANKTYIVTNVALNKSMVLDLNGSTIKLKSSTSAGRCVTVTADDVWVIGPGTLDGNKANQSTSNTACISATTTARGRLLGVHVTNGEVYGIHLEEAVSGTITDWRIENNRFSACTNYAIKVVANAGNITGVRAVGNYIDQTATAGGCISFGENASATISECEISGNRCLAAAASAVDVVHCFGAGTLNRVENNYVQGGDIGISIANGQSHATVVGNIVYNADVIGIEIADSTYCTVTGNVVQGNANTASGISIDGTNTDAQSTTVTGNTVLNVTGQGIYFFAGTPGSVASSNTVDVADAAAYGIRVLASDQVALIGNNLEGSGTALVGILINNSSYVSCDGNQITNWAAQAILMGQTSAGTMDYISITGGMILNTSFFAAQASGGGALGTHISHSNVAGWYFTSATVGLGDVWDWKNFIGNFRGAGASPEGVITGGIGSTYIQTDGAAGNQFWIKESGTGNTGWRRQGNILTTEVTVAYTDLASAASKTLVAALSGARFKVRNIVLSGGGTNFSGGGGDRLMAIQDSSGTTIWSVVPAATMQSLAFSRWGDTGVPAPGTAAHLTAQSVAGEALVAKYSGGTLDYTAGSLTLLIEYERAT
jgi:parallel beta-helix repeat protein